MHSKLNCHNSFLTTVLLACYSALQRAIVKEPLYFQRQSQCASPEQGQSRVRVRTYQQIPMYSRHLGNFDPFVKYPVQQGQVTKYDDIRQVAQVFLIDKSTLVQLCRIGQIRVRVYPTLNCFCPRKLQQNQPYLLAISDQSFQSGSPRRQYFTPFIVLLHK